MENSCKEETKESIIPYEGHCKSINAIAMSRIEHDHLRATLNAVITDAYVMIVAIINCRKTCTCTASLNNGGTIG